jgi:ubiquinone/menaquinone biosynthesis C-methylase UbiE
VNPFNDLLYNETFEKACELMGTSGAFFADYQAQQLRTWFPEYNEKSINILDFGCGDGAMTSFISYYFNHAQIHGADNSHESIEFAQQYYEPIQFHTLNKSSTNYPENRFDMIYTTEVFHHIPRNEHQAWISELVRITKPGGHIIIIELNPLNPITTLRFMFNPLERTARMLFPWNTKKLCKPYGTITTKFFSFPRFMKPLEKYMNKIPCGALYATVLKTSKL